MKEAKIDERFEHLIAAIDERFGQSGPPPLSFREWCEKSQLILDGRPFTFKRHEYLIEPYKDTHHHQVEMKAAQMGLTSKAMLRVAYGARYGNYRGILYLFPSKSDVTDFSKGRIDPLIQENPETIAKWIRDTDAANIKRIWNSFLYLRGMKSRVGLKSVPADFVIFDELDEASQTAVDMAMERMSHSDVKEVLKLSNPTLPNYGIDRAFQETDQRYWLLKCEKCGEYTCLEDEFPNCLLKVKEDKVIRACKKCHAELNPAIGQWVAKRPDVEGKRGYHYSQLFSQFVSPADILYQFDTTDNLTDFYNLKIGIPYVDAENRLSSSDVWACCGLDLMVSLHSGPCFMGVDVGTHLHVVVGFKPNELTKEVAYIARVTSFNDLHDIAKRFNVRCAVIDALPETRKAREFQRAESFEVFLCYYNEHQKGSTAYDSKKGIAQVNRTEILDAVHDVVTNPGELLLPRRGAEELEVFVKEMTNTAKVIEEDEETGSREYVYKKLGPDHYRHAMSYALVAAERIGIYDPYSDDSRPRDRWDPYFDDAYEDDYYSKNWMGM